MLQEEIWLERVGERAGLQRETVSKLWQALVSLLETSLTGGRAVDLGHLGILSLELVGECLARTAEGQIYLIPPRLIPRLSYSQEREANALRLEGLSGLLAEATGLPQSTTDPFLSAIIPLTLEQLSGGNSVAWGGVGVWAVESFEDCPTYVVEVSQTFRDNLNKSFGMFAPTLASEGLINKGDLQMVELGTLSDLDQTLYLRGQFVEEPEEEEPASAEDTPEIDESERGIDHSQGEAEGVPSANLPENDLSSSDYMEEDEDTPPFEELEAEADALLSEAEIRQGRRRIYWALLLVLLALCLCSLWLLRDEARAEDAEAPQLAKEELVIKERSAPEGTRSDRPTPQELPKNQSDPSEPQAELLSSQRTEQPSINVDSSSRVVRPSGRVADREELVILREGENLESLAERKYGDPVFWVYIYEENREFIANPYEVPSGLRLRLPSAEKYRIDVHDTNSRRQALVLQRIYQSERVSAD